jgi:hypothetical protein
LDGVYSLSMTANIGNITLAVRDFAQGTKTTLSPRKYRYFLGENILLDYRVTYSGRGRLSLWHGGLGNGSRDCRLVAFDEAGRRAPASTLPLPEGGAGCHAILRGETATLSIPLMRFCRLEKPGRYRVRAAYDLGWSGASDQQKWLPPIPPDDPRWAETTIAVEMPDAAQARDVVRNMRELPSQAHEPTNADWDLPDYADFTCLQYEIYLPILAELAGHQDGDERALTGIAHIPTSEATAALVRLLHHESKDFAFRVAYALNDRLPEPRLANWGDRANQAWSKDADPRLVNHTWRADFAPPVRSFARELMSESNLTRLRCGAFMMETVGRAEDAPALIEALERTIRVVEQTSRKRANSFHLQAITPERKCFRDLVRAAAAMAGRDARPSPSPRTRGEFIQWLVTIAQCKEFRPVGWETRWTYCAGCADPYTVEVALLDPPAPLPHSLNEDYRKGLQKLIAETTEPSVLHRGVKAALIGQFQPDEVLGMLVDRLDSASVYLYAYQMMSDIVENGNIGPLTFYCMEWGRIPSHYDAVRACWNRFVKEYGVRVRNGERFYVDDYDTLPGIPIPSTDRRRPAARE